MNSGWVVHFYNGSILGFSEQGYTTEKYQKKLSEQWLNSEIQMIEHWHDIEKAKEKYKEQVYFLGAED